MDARDERRSSTARVVVTRVAVVVFHVPSTRTSRFTARVVKEIFAPLRSTLAFARIRIARFAPIAGVAVIAVIAIIVRVARAFARLRSCVLASPRSRSARV